VKATVCSILAVALLSTACIGSKKTASKEDLASVESNILAALPEGVTKVDINYEGKVTLVGYTLSPAIAPPGTEVKVTYYWECKEKLDEGWMLFTHLVNEGQMLNLDGNGPLRADRNGTQLLGPSKWEPGKIYADSQTFTVPDWDTAELTVKIGVWKDNSRLRVTRGENDGQEAGIPVRIKTGKAKAAPPKPVVPELAVPHLAAGESIAIDGKPDDTAWARAVSTGAFVDVGTGAPNKSSPVDGSVKLLWDDTSMYLFFEVSDPDIIGGYQDPKSQPTKFTATGLPKLWENDTVEIMTDPDGDGDNVDYYELQINPQNKVFHSQFDGYNAPKGGDNGPFGHEDWDPKLKSAVVVKGTMDKPGDKDIGYAVEVQIPWGAFSKAKRTPPTAEDTWRMNFYAMKNNGGVAWSPILGQGNFHKATRFGRVRFVGGKVVAVQDAGVVGDAAVARVADAAALPFRHLPMQRKGVLKLPH
jgi:hypothetical protein